MADPEALYRRSLRGGRPGGGRPERPCPTESSHHRRNPPDPADSAQLVRAFAPVSRARPKARQYAGESHSPATRRRCPSTRTVLLDLPEPWFATLGWTRRWPARRITSAGRALAPWRNRNWHYLRPDRYSVTDTRSSAASSPGGWEPFTKPATVTPADAWH
jgi:hypothetical protein